MDKVRYLITADTDGNVLELARQDESGEYLRVEGEWERVNPDLDEESYPTYYDQPLYFVSSSATTLFDELESSEDYVELSRFSDHIIED